MVSPIFLPWRRHGKTIFRRCRSICHKRWSFRNLIFDPVNEFLYDSLQHFTTHSVTLALLRTRSMPLFLAFCHQEFKTDHEMTRPYGQLIERLSNFLEDINYQDQDEETATGRFFDHTERAKILLERWIEQRYLRTFMDDQNREQVVVLSKHTEKAFQIIELLRDREFVGTESKFREIFRRLQELIEYANPDKAVRLAELEKQKKLIETEIHRIQTDGQLVVFEDYQVKSRFEELTRLANELVSDFKEVEENFKDITRRIYESMQVSERSKGQLLHETFDALHELRRTDQGRSFYAFWQFMLNDHSQDELQHLTRTALQVLEDRNIAPPSQYRNIRRLKNMLHSAGRKVLEKNDLLAEKLSREIVAKEQNERRQTRALMSAIRQYALARVGRASNREHYLVLDGDPDIHLPLERKLGERSIETRFVTQAAPARLDADALAALGDITSGKHVDKKKLMANIEAVLQEKSPATLPDVLARFPLSHGLAEVLAYFSLLHQSPRFFVSDRTTDLILFDSEQGKYLEIPQLVFNL
ncbi:MAG: DUF3375 domain-containing protein [Saprospiraceae bacterium]|nr:DUF3375 domain-containing protein [Saprospiraceae bacterium]